MSTSEEKIHELELTVSRLEGEFNNLRENMGKSDESLTEGLKALEKKIDDLPCDDVRTQGLPKLSNAVTKLQVYQVVTWTLLLLIIGGLVGVAIQVMSAGGVP